MCFSWLNQMFTYFLLNLKKSGYHRFPVLFLRCFFLIFAEERYLLHEVQEEKRRRQEKAAAEAAAAQAAAP